MHDFTLPSPASTPQKRRKIQYTIWCVSNFTIVRVLIWHRQSGIGSSQTLANTTKTHLSNRTEVLRFLLSLLSSTIYLTPNHFLTTLLTMKERKATLSLLCSLINTCTPKSDTTLIISPSEAFNKLQVVTTGQRDIDEQASALPRLCFALLDVLLISHDLTQLASEPPPSPGILSPTFERADLSFGSPKAGSDNIFRYYCSKLHQSNDYAFLLSMILGWLNAVNNASTSLMSTMPASIPGLSGMMSSKSEQATEAVAFLWRMLECNKASHSVICK